MLSEEEADDLLYCSRVGELEDMKQMIKAILQRAGKEEQDSIAFNSLMSEVALKNEGNNTLLHFAAANGHTNVLSELIAKCNLSVMLSQNESGNTPLHWASLNGHLEAVQILIKRFDELESQQKRNGTIHAQNDVSEAEDDEKEAQKRSVWDVVNKSGMGPMSTAQVNGRDNVVSFLLEHMIHGATKPSKGAEGSEVAASAETPQANGHDDSLEIKTEKLDISQT